MTLEELRTLRVTAQKAMDRRVGGEKNIEIVVGMGTSGLAAGAKNTLNAFLDELNAKDIRNVILRQSDFMGYNQNEPTVEVQVKGMPKTLYGNVDTATAREIVRSHILEKKLVEKHVLNQTAKDTSKEK